MDSQITPDWLKKHGRKLKILYSYAVTHKLDVASTSDVLQILKAADPENANTKSAIIFSKMLQLFASRFRATVREKIR